MRVPAAECFARLFSTSSCHGHRLVEVFQPIDAGKLLGNDAVHGKLTYPSLLGIEESRLRAQKMCDQAVAAVEPLGPAAVPLQDLARSVCCRDR